MLTVSMGEEAHVRTPNTRQVIQVYTDPTIPDDPIGPIGTDERAWAWAQVIAEKHYAGWLHYLAGRPVPGLILATAVTVEGLARRRPHPQGCFTWQVEGAALITAAGVTLPELEQSLSDYRTAAGRIDRKRSVSAERARAICADMERGEHPRDAIAAHKLPSVPRIEVPVPAPDVPVQEALRFYREAMVSGEVS